MGSNDFEGSDGGPLPVEQLAAALVSQLDFVHSCPAYHAVWVTHQLHCGPYAGPTYEKQLDALRERLGMPKPDLNVIDVPSPVLVSPRRTDGEAG